MRLGGLYGLYGIGIGYKKYSPERPNMLQCKVQAGHLAAIKIAFGQRETSTDKRSKIRQWR